MTALPVGIGFAESRLPRRSRMLGVGAATLFFAAAAAMQVAPPIALAIAVPFALIGVHALLSGMSGAPTRLVDIVTGPLFGLILLAGIIGLAVMAAWRSIAWLAAAVFLLGATTAGYLVAAFIIAPVFAGGVSYDMTRWTETVIAAAMLLAGTAVTIGVAEKRRRIFAPATAPARGAVA